MKISGDKISWIASHLCDENESLAEKLGENSNTVSNWISRSIGLGAAEKIIDSFPEIDMNWFIKGIGDPIKSTLKGRFYEIIDKKSVIVLSRQEYDEIIRENAILKYKVENMEKEIAAFEESSAQNAATESKCA